MRVAERHMERLLLVDDDVELCEILTENSRLRGSRSSLCTTACGDSTVHGPASMRS